MEINGIAHVMLTVSNFEACLPFYQRLLPFLGMKPVIDADGMLYCVGGRTAVGIVRAEDARQHERFVQLRVGLHHLCFRARTREDVDALKGVMEEEKFHLNYVEAEMERLFAGSKFARPCSRIFFEEEGIDLFAEARKP